MAITEGKGRVWVERVRELAQEGVEYLVVREKALEAGELAALSREVVEVVRGTRMRVLIAERVDVAAAVGADGVHLSARRGELRPEQVRVVMPGAFVSVSCHTVAEVDRARENGASAVVFGPVFGKWVDGVEVMGGVGLERLRAASAAAGEVPVFALGGVTAATEADCGRAGASGVAGVRMFWRR